MTVFAAMRYDEDSSLVDVTGHRWRRARDWLEPADAAVLVEQGTPFLMQLCGGRPRAEWLDRFGRDVAPRLMTRSEVAAAAALSTVPTIVNPELWAGVGSAPTVVLFIEGAPGPRGANELINDWE